LVDGRTVKILCVDDEPLITKVISKIMHDHEVVEYSDACAAIFHLTDVSRPHYDVIVCDLIMPDCSGVDLHRMMSRYRPDLLPRIVFSSGAATMPGVESFLSSVPNRRLDKPFRIDQLRSMLLEVGSRPA
jgi:CheY-like chemotaxis protein